MRGKLWFSAAAAALMAFSLAPDGVCTNGRPAGRCVHPQRRLTGNADGESLPCRRYRLVSPLQVETGQPLQPRTRRHSE